MSNPTLFKLTNPTGGLRHTWFQIITRFLLCFTEDDRPCLDGLWFYIPSWKAFLAMLTLIRFLFGMSSDVIFEGIFPGKTFLAMLALTSDMVSLCCEFYSFARLLVSTKHFMLGITCTDMVFLWCEFLIVSPDNICKIFLQCSHWYGFSLGWIL